MGEYLRSEDFVNGKDGQIQLVVDGEIITLYGSQKFKASSTPETSERGQIGTRNKQSKIKGFKNKISITADYWFVQVMTDILKKYKKTGIFPKVDCQCINNDKGTSLGVMSKVYYDLVPDGDITLQELDESKDEGLTTDIAFTFRDWDELEAFNRPANIGRD
ncbi:PF09393 family protein [Peptoanaerobacter stomatis]|uniref:PF09393 family protein n=1 Tax=Peptoanaerobacter stomatis TaxID=796937 RepID=J6H7I1_9FIRM|nr:phage tail tube protein [Peptoanaerobacter stomatis]EJU21175.1 PF09393 family protein [Peptoanaerobacter stomatis]